jgi:DNA repair protein RecO (recombination protein O)
MHWEDEGFVLAARPHGESGLVVQLLTGAHGRHAGLVRGGQGRKLRGVFEIGNRVAVAWNARLAEHLGTIAGELTAPHAARVIADPARLACLAAAAAVAESTLPEREPHPRVFAGMAALFQTLDADRGWAPAYVVWELALLAELGFGLDLARCVATGESRDLVYVSPKSGHAVSAAAGAPYREKLLPLPRFLLPGEQEAPPPAGVVDGLRLTGYFLERRVLAPHARALPPARARFVDLVERLARMSADENSLGSA